MSIVPRNLHTKYGLNMAQDKGVIDVSLWLPEDIEYFLLQENCSHFETIFLN